MKKNKLYNKIIKPNFVKILKNRYLGLSALLLTFVYNIVKGKNWGDILFTEAIVLLFTCDTLKIPKLFNDEEKNLIPGVEGAKLGENNYISNEEAFEFYQKLRLTPIDDNNRTGLRLILNELKSKLNK